MDWIASQITSLPVVCSIVYSGVNQRKHQSSASLAFFREIHRGPANFPHKWPVTRKMFQFDDVIMVCKELMQHVVPICNLGRKRIRNDNRFEWPPSCPNKTSKPSLHKWYINDYFYIFLRYSKIRHTHEVLTSIFKRYTILFASMRLGTCVSKRTSFQVEGFQI